MPIRPVIAVSACLLGQNVRYDGRLKTCAEVHDLLAAAADLVPLCPETGVGMPVPREPVDLVGSPASPRMVGGVTGEDWTDRVAAWCAANLDRLEQMGVAGFVLKARSPSCGVGTSPIFPEPCAAPVPGDGLFAAAARRRFPHLPVVEDEDLRGEGFAVFLAAVAAASGR